MIELRKGMIGEEEQILDFANYIFNVDFPTLIPKVYARPDHAPGAGHLPLGAGI